MAKFEPSAIRNVALIGHGDAGKTTLAEHLLFLSKAIPRVGKVAEGTTTSDYAEDERERHHSIDCGLVHFEHKGVRVNLIDTPGSPDFVGDAICGLSAADGAVLCINASAGLAVNTRRMWARAGVRGIPRMIVITKLDHENLDFDKLLAQIQEAFGAECVPFSLPDQTGEGISRVARCFQTVREVPEGMADRVAEAGQALVERIVEADEGLMERYFEGAVEDAEVAAALPAAVHCGSLVPIFCTSLEKECGLAPVLDALVDLMPSAASVRIAGIVPGSDEGDSDGEVVTREPSVDAPLCGQVFGLMTDDYVGRISFVRIYSGRLAASDLVWTPGDHKPEKSGALLDTQGKEQETLEEGTAGMILGVTKCEQIHIGSTICSQSDPIQLPEIKLPRPMVSLAVEAASRADEGKIGAALRRVCDEDPSFTAIRDTSTRELVCSGITDLHLRLMLDRLKRRFHVETETHQPRIPYLETITKEAQASYRHKKQTGGRGQFGEVHIRIAPRERGSGFEYVDAIVGGVISRQFIPAVEKGIVATMADGVVAGYQMIDVQVELYDGKEHAVDSSEEAFKRAGSGAFKEAVAKAGPGLLEPIVDLEVTVTADKMGDITSDLNTRRGHIQGMDTDGAFQTIKAKVPLGEIQTYSTELRSITGGEGTYTLEFSHYDLVPTHKVQEIIKATQKAAEEKEKKK